MARQYLLFKGGFKCASGDSNTLTYPGDETSTYNDETLVKQPVSVPSRICIGEIAPIKLPSDEYDHSRTCAEFKLYKHVGRQSIPEQLDGLSIQLIYRGLYKNIHENHDSESIERYVRETAEWISSKPIATIKLAEGLSICVARMPDILQRVYGELQKLADTIDALITSSSDQSCIPFVMSCILDILSGFDINIMRNPQEAFRNLWRAKESMQFQQPSSWTALLWEKEASIYTYKYYDLLYNETNAMIGDLMHYKGKVIDAYRRAQWHYENCPCEDPEHRIYNLIKYQTHIAYMELNLPTPAAISEYEIPGKNLLDACLSLPLGANLEEIHRILVILGEEEGKLAVDSKYRNQTAFLLTYLRVCLCLRQCCIHTRIPCAHVKSVLRVWGEDYTHLNTVRKIDKVKNCIGKILRSCSSYECELDLYSNSNSQHCLCLRECCDGVFRALLNLDESESYQHDVSVDMSLTGSSLEENGVVSYISYNTDLL